MKNREYLIIILKMSISHIYLNGFVYFYIIYIQAHFYENKYRRKLPEQKRSQETKQGDKN